MFAEIEARELDNSLKYLRVYSAADLGFNFRGCAK